MTRLQTPQEAAQFQMELALPIDRILLTIAQLFPRGFDISDTRAVNELCAVLQTTPAELGWRLGEFQSRKI